MDALKRRGDGVCRGSLIVAVALMAGLHLAGSPCRGQTEDEIDPTGGLRSRDTSPPPAAGPSSREELVREWDLDFNGSIDVNEAAVARARMRRSRQEMESGMEIDPLTGKPRSEAAGKDDEDRAPEADAPVVEPPVNARRRTSGEASLPGTRVPDVKNPVTSGTMRSAPQPPGSRAGSGASGSPRPWSSLAPARPGARPGYGTITPKPDLNAGMPKPVLGRGGFPGTPGGGLLPSVRSPGVVRPLTPAAPRPLPQRVTADEIGGF